MKPAAFEHHVPETVEEAVGLLGEHGDTAKILAGGQSLVPLLALRLARFEHLVDLNRVPALVGISMDDGWLRVGAMTRQAAAERSNDVRTSVPLLSRALPHVGHFQVRNRGTVGGSLAHADPASELPAVAVALDAEFVVAGPTGARSIAAQDFFISTWTSTLEADEVLTSVRFPLWTRRCGFRVEEFARRHGDFAIAGVACGIELDENARVVRAGMALFGMGPTPMRARTAEAALVGSPANQVDIPAVARAAVGDCAPGEDLHGSAGYRRRVATHLVQRSITATIEEATRA